MKNLISYIPRINNGRELSSILARTCLLACFIVPGTSHGFIGSLWGSDEESKSDEASAANQVKKKAEKPELDKYGFEKVDKTEEQKRLIAKFTNDRDQLDKAIDNTKALIHQSQGKVYLPELYLRLAELYIEKSRVAYFLRRTESGAAVRNQLESLESNALKSQAIETYKRIIHQYPEFKSMDKVHFYLAHEFRELNRLPEMVDEYKTIIKKYPKSDFVAEAHLLLADYYSGKKNLTAAKKHYLSVLKYPESSAITIAQYKLAWVHISKKEYAEAIKLLERSVKGPGAGNEVEVDTYGRVDIRSEAFNDMAFVYSNHYKKATPEQALAYFKDYAWSRPAYIVVLEKLAYRYLIKKKWKHASIIYRELSNIQNDPEKLLEYADSIYTAVRELKSFDNAYDDVKVVVAALRRIKYSVHVAEEVKQKAFTDYEIFARDVSTQLHAKSKASKNLQDFEKTADAYELYLDFFTDSDKFAEMQLNFAEALFNAQRFTEAGEVYEKLAANTDQEKVKEEYLYSATLSFYEALKNRKGLNYYETVLAQSGLAQTGAQYVDSFPKSKQVPNVLFNVAWIRYDEGKYKEAIKEFSRFIEKYPTGKEAKAAVQLIVDSYTVMEDFEGLIAFDKELQKNQKIALAVRQGVSELAKTAESKMVSNLTVASIEDWETGKDELLEFAQKHKSSAMGAQALNALFISSKEKNDIETMQMTGQNIIANYPKSQDAENVLNSMIEASIRTSQFRVLASNLEQYSKHYKGTPTAKEFLMQAAQIRQSLNQPAMANGLYRTLLSQYKLASGQRRDLAVAMAENELNRGNAKGAIQALESQRKNVAGGFRTDIDARLATLYWDLGQPQRANRYLQSAVNGFQQGHGQDIQPVKDNLAKLFYTSAGGGMEDYMNTKLQGVIDNEVVGAKTQMFEQLQSGYYSVLDFESPKWSLLALYRLYEVNIEYANFLEDAPLPDMSSEEKAQYKAIIGQKVAEYRAEAEQFIQTGQQLSERLESFDPQLANYEKSVESMSEMTAFAESQSRAEIGINAFKDEELRSLHNRMSHDPKDMESLVGLAKAYYDRGDLGQANVIVQGVLTATNAESEVKANAYTLAGLTAIAAGDDQLAREHFEQAIQEEPSHKAAHINLGSLWQHYGFAEKAKSHFSKASSSSESDDFIHKRAKQITLAGN